MCITRLFQPGSDVHVQRFYLNLLFTSQHGFCILSCKGERRFTSISLSLCSTLVLYMCIYCLDFSTLLNIYIKYYVAIILLNAEKSTCRLQLSNLSAPYQIAVLQLNPFRLNMPFYRCNPTKQTFTLIVPIHALNRQLIRSPKK